MKKIPELEMNASFISYFFNWFDCVRTLNPLFADLGIEINDHNKFETEFRLTEKTKIPFPQSTISDLHKWWMAHNQTSLLPTWDLVTPGQIYGNQGYIFIIGMTHVTELSIGGKNLDFSASAAARENHEHIKEAISEANAVLNQNDVKVIINRDDYYQSSSHISWIWKMASFGIPCALIYIGFIDSFDLKDTFKSQKIWDDRFSNYIGGTFPLKMINKKVEIGNTIFLIGSRTLDMLELMEGLQLSELYLELSKELNKPKSPRIRKPYKQPEQKKPKAESGECLLLRKFRKMDKK